MIICVYGAASDKIAPEYIEKVEILGKKMAQRGHSLVYGAGATGLMGAVARGVYAEKGEIIGVAPTFFNVDGILFENCTELIGTETMRERKQMMEDKADAFIMVPGGIGTFDEFFEILTLKQLDRHNKALVIYNINNYYDCLSGMMKNAVNQHFTTPETIDLYKISDNADEILDYIENYVPSKNDIEILRNLK
ncbi:MAG: TIGR00730 family Rossman fold protein [Clostridia bacterium]|nr:TIGR00730 family Rossman fold protein [Clostridia bacterium]